MIIHREIGSSYHHEPIVWGVDYSPLMVESKEEALVKEERWREAIPAVVPLPVFLQRQTTTPLVLCFSIFASAFLEIVTQTPYRMF
jgi:hypothetical protein